MSDHRLCNFYKLALLPRSKEAWPGRSRTTGDRFRMMFCLIVMAQAGDYAAAGSSPRGEPIYPKQNAVPPRGRGGQRVSNQCVRAFLQDTRPRSRPAHRHNHCRTTWRRLASFAFLKISENANALLGPNTESHVVWPGWTGQPAAGVGGARGGVFSRFLLLLLMLLHGHFTPSFHVAGCHARSGQGFPQRHE